ncbi:PAS domain-containing protein [Peribacillus frigoritolerans]|nr:PAS domain-containing protein [Peribacillus frigoritolerans]
MYWQEDLKNKVIGKRQEYILDHFNEGVISLNVTGRIIQINHKAIELLDLQKRFKGNYSK